MDRLIALLALRLKLELRALARARETAMGLVVLVPGLLLLAALGGGAAFVGLRHLEAMRPEWVLPLLSTGATLVGVFWALSPLLAGLALSETHDVSRLLHFPIPPRTLVVSSFASNMLQPSMLAVVPVAIAAAFGVTRRWPLLPLAVVGMLLAVLFMLAAAQVAGLLLQALGRNRRWHDIALFFGIGLGFLMSLGPALVLTAGGRHLAWVARTLAEHDVFVLSPFAWGVRAAVHGARGEVIRFGGFALLSVVATIVAVAASTVLIERMHRSEVVSGSGRGRGGRARMWLPGALGALVEKDLRAGWRDPAIRAAFFIGLAGPLVFLFLLTRTRGGWTGTPLLLLATFVGLSPFGANAFGLERRGISLLMSFPLARWKLLVAKNLGALLLRAPSVLMILVAGALLAPVEYVPAAAALVLMTLLISAGMDNFFSVLFPAPVPAPGANPYAGMSGSRGLGAAIVGACLLVAVVALCAPFIFLVWLPSMMGRPRLWLATLPVALIGALAVYTMLVILAERLLVRREPEMLERVLGEV